MPDDSRPPDNARPPDPRTPPPPRQDGRGWRVSPAPDGRGGDPEKPKPPMIGMSWRRFLTILAALFALNYLAVAVFAPPPERVRIPYSPTFLGQVREGNQAEHFDTQVPSFADDRQLSTLLQQHGVTVNAKPPNERSLLETLLFSFGPTILLV